MDTVTISSDQVFRKPLIIDEYPCKYVNVNGTKDQVACHMELAWIDPETLPMVSILTPTYNRGMFEKLMLRNWNAIDYPRDKLEWIIVDDSDDKKLSLNTQSFNSKNIRYIKINDKLTLGKKRNFLASLARGSILVHMDDDDFYPPENVISRVKSLLLSDGKECVGCNKTLCYDLINDQTFEAFDPSTEFPNIPCTISESTLAYTKEFWKSQQYDDSDTYAECLKFIENRSDEIILIPYIFVVTQLSHNSNTIKRWMLRSTQHTVQFIDNISMMDNLLIQDLRARIVQTFPEWKDSIDFVNKYHNLDKKQFIRRLEKTPKLKNNPFIINHIRSLQSKKVSNGKEIVYYCGPGRYLNFSNTWNGNSVGLGGSEEAVVNLSEQFVKLGYTVTVYNICDKQTIVNGVNYVEHWKWSPLDKQHLTIVWRDPSILDTNINSNKVILDLHDVIDPLWLTNDRLNNVSQIYCKSQFHKDLLKDLLKDTTKDKIKIIPNGIDSTKFNSNCIFRKQNTIMSTSSPDRCITSLLYALPIIRSEIGLEDTQIIWAYGFKSGISKGGMESHQDPEIQKWVNKTKSLILKTEGFVDLGRISHKEIIELTQSSNIFAYGTVFPEIDCISLTKAMAGGAIPIVTSVGAIGEKVKFFNHMEISEQVVDPKMTYDSIDYSINGPEFYTWVQKLIKQLKTNTSDNDRNIMSDSVCKNYNWKNISKTWLN
jgi:glycosyltransferase involved in cell wall biosynthesis